MAFNERREAEVLSRHREIVMQDGEMSFLGAPNSPKPWKNHFDFC